MAPNHIDIESLDEPTRETIVVAGMEFMRTITEAFGTEPGIALWNTISDTLGDDLKGAIFFRLITGDTGSNMTIMSTNTKSATSSSRFTSNDFISYIKCIRTYTGMGLKEAKDICDLTEGGQHARLEITYKKKPEFIRELAKIGVKAV
jgi:hypothetical protein